MRMPNSLIYGEREIDDVINNPEIRDFDGEKREFCGVASSYDSRVSSLPECWLKMSKSQRTTYANNKRIELQGLQIRGK